MRIKRQRSEYLGGPRAKLVCAGNTLQEEHHWLCVQLNEFDHRNVRFYLGCSNCGSGGYEDIGVAYTCHTCIKENVVSSPRIVMTFKAADETGAYPFTALTENAEKLLDEKEDYLLQVENQLRSNPVYIQVKPAKSLSRTQVLKWELEQVSLI